MEIRIQPFDGITVVVVEGSLDALTAPQLTAALDEQLERGRIHLVIDFSLVDYSASAGIAAVLRIFKNVTAQEGRVCLAGLQDGVRRTFEISGLLRVIQVYPHVEAALEHWD